MSSAGIPFSSACFLASFAAILRGRVHGQQMIGKLVELQQDQLDDRRARRADDGAVESLPLHQLFWLQSVTSSGRKPHFKHLVEPKRQKPFEDEIRIV